MSKVFFAVPTPESLTKIEIVWKYFDAWSKVLAPKSNRIGYVDVFSGPGRYDDGTDSVPIHVLKVALEKSLQGKLIAVFNDIDFKPDLERNIRTIPNFGTFRSIPKVHDYEIGNDPSPFSRLYEPVRDIPTLSFIDPWGYKGLSLELVASTVHPFGCDCLFFFNYARINHALEVDNFTENMDVIFGQQRRSDLQERIAGMSPTEREKRIVAEVTDILKASGAQYVHHFGFAYSDKNTTSHYLFHLSKNNLANRIIKQITSKLSTSQSQGVAKFRYKRDEDPQQELFDQPADDLQESLMILYEGKNLSVAGIISDHSRRTSMQYTDKNYKDVLQGMEQASIVKMDRPFFERPAGTLADSVMVYFPKKRTPKH